LTTCTFDQVDWFGNRMQSTKNFDYQTVWLVMPGLRGSLYFFVLLFNLIPNNFYLGLIFFSKACWKENWLTAGAAVVVTIPSIIL